MFPIRGNSFAFFMPPSTGNRKPSTVNRQPSTDAGFTIIETLAASAILALAITAFFSLITSGRSIDITDQHRRRARAIIDSVFEDTTYHHRRFDNLTASPPQTTVNISSQIAGALDIAIENKSLDMPPPNLDVNTKQIQATVTWNEPDGPLSIYMYKHITNIQN